MNIEKLRTLEEHAYQLSSWTCALVELETVPDLNIPDGFESKKEYREHIGNMIGAHRILLGVAYNNIDEWQDV
jgi:hypothetical protein